MKKVVYILPYINISKVIKINELEIYPYEKYSFDNELSKKEQKNLRNYVFSFRKSIFQKGKTPDIVEGIGILKYKGTILRTEHNSDGIDKYLKILFLLLKLHISYDFYNPGMNHIHFKSFDLFSTDLSDECTNKFRIGGKYSDLYSTIPENVNGLKDVKFYPLIYSVNSIPVELKFFKGGDAIFWSDESIIDFTEIYKKIKKNKNYYKKIINISSVHYGLEQQSDLFFYYSIIPTIIEVLNPPKGKKKKSGVNFGKRLDLLIKNNDYLEVDCCGEKQRLGLISRTILLIYDLRNKLLHEGKKVYENSKIQYKGYSLKIYDLFQLIFKYSILNDFVDKGIVENKFVYLIFKGSVFTTGYIDILAKTDSLYMDNELSILLEKAKTDKLYK